MTEENLNLANRKMEQIKKMQDFIAAFRCPYVNIIKASDYQTDKTIIINTNDELHNLILKHCESKLERLKEEFQKI